MALNEDQRREFRAKYSSAHNLRAATEKYQENPGDQEARSIVSHEIFGDDSLVANPLEVWDSVMQNDFPPLLTARNDSLRTFTVDNLTDILEGIENSDHRFMVLATAPHRPEYPDQGLNTAHGDFQRAAENYKNPNLDGIVQDLEENYEISRATLVLWSNHNRDGLKKAYAANIVNARQTNLAATLRTEDGSFDLDKISNYLRHLSENEDAEKAGKTLDLIGGFYFNPPQERQ